MDSTALPPADPVVPRGPSPLARFVLVTLAWLPVAFAVWYYAAPVILWLPALVAKLAAGAFGDLVRAVEQNGAELRFVTSLRPGTGTASGIVTVGVNALLYSYGLPMFAALTLAARGPGKLRRLAIGYAILVPFVAWGIVADFLKNVAISAGPAIASQTGFSSGERELIAFAYQFGALIMPTVAPAAVWVLMHRWFLERLR